MSENQYTYLCTSLRGGAEMLRVDLREMLSVLRDTPGCRKVTMMELHRKTAINRNILHKLAGDPFSLIKLEDLDELLDFLFKRFVEANAFDGRYQDLAFNLTSRMVQWVPNDPIVNRAVEKWWELRDEHGRIHSDDKAASWVLCFWTEYQRIYGLKKK
jgi:hypothetical protein